MSQPLNQNSATRFDWVLSLVLATAVVGQADAEDRLRRLQIEAVSSNRSATAHWGWETDNYLCWSTHTNRLVPVYTYGTAKSRSPAARLSAYQGENSAYRDAGRITEIYSNFARHRPHAEATYLDQTDLHRLQKSAARAGKKYIFLVVFDGMDWHTVWATSIFNTGHVRYREGRGTGTHFQDYTADGSSEFGFAVTSPWCARAETNVDTQRVSVHDDCVRGSYDPTRGGFHPWDVPGDLEYLVAGPQGAADLHAYTDSSSAATSLSTGKKTYNGSVNVDVNGRPLHTIAHELQRQGWAVGAISSVPFCHATPAAMYAHNVSRSDYQDLARDMLGISSISHPHKPLAGMDVVIGAGLGDTRDQDKGQGANFVAGNVYLTDEDLASVNLAGGGRYVVVTRTSGSDGAAVLEAAAEEAVQRNASLFGFFGGGRAKTHLPYQTANGDYQTAPGRNKVAETYDEADIQENPTLAEMTAAGLKILQHRETPFWLLVEAGDVDWASHDNNLDNMIGAVNSGDAAVKVITDWVERYSSWEESMMIVTSDHGHYLVIEEPELLCVDARPR